MGTTLQELEAALDSGRLEVCVFRLRGTWWKARRNGKTKRWQRDPTRFRIPVKAGFRLTGSLTEVDLVNLLPCWRIIP